MKSIIHSLKQLLHDSSNEYENWAQAALVTRVDETEAVNDSRYAQALAKPAHRRAKKGAKTAQKRAIENNRCQKRPGPRIALSHCSGWGFSTACPNRSGDNLTTPPHPPHPYPA